MMRCMNSKLHRFDLLIFRTTYTSYLVYNNDVPQDYNKNLRRLAVAEFGLCTVD